MTEATDFIEQVEFNPTNWARLYALLGWDWSDEDLEDGCPDTLKIKVLGARSTQEVKRNQSVVFYRGKAIDII